MINKSVVYKIKYIALKENDFQGPESWVHGFNVIAKTGGSGKTFTDKKIVNRMLANIQTNARYGTDFKCEIITFKLTETARSDKAI